MNKTTINTQIMDVVIISIIKTDFCKEKYIIKGQNKLNKVVIYILRMKPLYTMKNFVTINSVTTRITPKMNNIIISPQNQIDNIIHLRGGTSFLTKKSIGGRRDKIATQNITLILKLCS